MCYPASKKEGRGGTGQVGGKERHGRRTDEIADVVDGHDDDNRTAQGVDRLDSARPGRPARRRNNSRKFEAAYVSHEPSREFASTHPDCRSGATPRAPPGTNGSLPSAPLAPRLPDSCGTLQYPLLVSLVIPLSKEGGALFRQVYVRLREAILSGAFWAK